MECTPMAGRSPEGHSAGGALGNPPGGPAHAQVCQSRGGSFPVKSFLCLLTSYLEITVDLPAAVRNSTGILAALHWFSNGDILHDCCLSPFVMLSQKYHRFSGLKQQQQLWGPARCWRGWGLARAEGRVTGGCRVLRWSQGRRGSPGPLRLRALTPLGRPPPSCPDHLPIVRCQNQGIGTLIQYPFCF